MNFNSQILVSTFQTFIRMFDFLLMFIYFIFISVLIILFSANISLPQMKFIVQLEFMIFFLVSYWPM